MKCLVLGGGGFIGSAVCDRLLRDGHRVRVLARPKLASYRVFGPEEPMEWMRGDFLNVHDLREAVQGMDAVFHLVSTTVPKSANDDPIRDVQSNLVGALQLLQLLREQPVGKIIFVSSGGTVYGPPRYLPIDEDHPTNPLTAYGITKLAIEKHLQMFTHIHGVPSIILRVSNPYGPRQRIETAQGAVGVFLHRALAGAPIEIWGDGETTRDYIYIGDVAEVLARAVTYDGREQVFNVGTGQGTSLNALVEWIERVIDRPVQRVYRPARAFDVPVSVLDNTRIREAFDWSPQVGLPEGLTRTLAWIQQTGG
ncbi:MULTISPECIES: NAD-dependent epimerase/dehydratase family protein [Acidithiobacillus]|jgi:UDP-glucose 4-epimerase|uniref:NAD-dependent epimerase/dehydratase n=1 Tax=mine drainage metagenome TaxID=410659 RepID=E6QEN4_9ZZZZ|nr:NAD-dependent epimerase/dehydratase family protein [Acidithiobacillus ferrooxidans]MBU2861283.1 NAD-dependent epimerase/dehydratase family protein [Acidithiobacillus ferrooxidans]